MRKATVSNEMNDSQQAATSSKQQPASETGRELVQESGFEISSDLAGQVTESFDEYNLKEELLRGIYANGWEQPSPIQQRAVFPMICNRDVIAQAQSGTGKTGAFTISCLEKIDSTLQATQILVLAPTRELAKQISTVAQDLALYMDRVKIHLSVGGTSRKSDGYWARQNPHFVIGTPGRVLDLISRRDLDITRLSTLCLDEADEMLSRGFIDEMKDILAFVPQDVQLCLFSATLPDEILQLTNKFMRSPARILVKQEQLSLEGIGQYYVVVPGAHKFQCLCDLYATISLSQTIIYCNTKIAVDRLADQMHQRMFTCSRIHGDLTQDERDLRMQEFRSGSSRVLITTYLLARGIDAGVSCVFNYDLPYNLDAYLHRIGRSGRFGKKGVAINFVDETREDTKLFHDIQNYYHIVIDELPADLAPVFDF